MTIDLETLLQEAHEKVGSAADLRALDDVRVAYLGKTGAITEQLKQLGKLPKEERSQAGQAINKAKQTVQKAMKAEKSHWSRKS